MAEKAKDKTKKEKKSSDKPAKKKPNRIVKWFRELRSEFKKVVWPTKKQVITNTSVVLAVMVVSSIFVGALDLGFMRLLRLLLGIGE